ncbi:hypothetical protein AAHA92_04717 [Salvia divinorum]|uniref:NB-ARC domain-containing protein n=1 Tax=Salvia divinorum TaxID=28513 RepID=A0ABD1I052_SALDI
MAAYAALASLLQTTDVNKYEANNLFSVEAEKKIASIHEMVRYFQSFLGDFPHISKSWERRIRDVAHEAEDIIERFTRLPIQPFHRGKDIPNLDDQLGDVLEKIGEIAGEVMEDRPSDLPAAVSSPSPSPSSSSSSRSAPTQNDAVIGLDEDLTAIKGRLCGEPSDLQIIPIVGMAGIGKTTLARAIYEDSFVVHRFDIRAWITVSQDYSPNSFRKIVIGLLESMKLLQKLLSRKKNNGPEDLNKQLDEIDLSEMTTIVFQTLKFRRYLIVMDDVWSTKVWDDLMMFPDDGNGSRIMMTTRLSQVAIYPRCCSLIHEMKVMTNAQSWDLLKQKVLKNGVCPPHLKEIGEAIARRCAGLPLAVVLVAGLLSAVSDTQASWEEIARNINTAVGRELDEILSLSYTHLPHHLRPFFLYLGGFPEDENIRAETLIRLWEAEGFLKHDNECDKNLPEEYLEDLVKRNLVSVNSRRFDGKIKSCSLHDMVRDMCVRKARDEKFLGVTDGRSDPQEMIDERRISLSACDTDRLLVSTTRTILCFELEFSPMFLCFLEHLSLLRVLHSTSAIYEAISSHVFQLSHLRYLALRGPMEITPAISNLVSLETLVIHPVSRWSRNYTNAGPLHLPLEIWRMEQLKHIIVYDRCILPHPSSDTPKPLINLQTLSLVTNLVWTDKLVQMIPNVKTLGLVYTALQDPNLGHLENLLQLEKLQVSMIGDSCRKWQNPILPTTLKKLTLVKKRLPWEDMSIIGSLPNLQVLKLLDYALEGATWATGDDEFAELKYLLIGASSLQHWTVHESSFATLKRLTLCCPGLERVPGEIGEISTLELIEMGGCKESAVDSANEIIEDRKNCGDDALHLRYIGQRRVWSWKSFSDEVRRLAPHLS